MCRRGGWTAGAPAVDPRRILGDGQPGRAAPTGTRFEDMPVPDRRASPCRRSPPATQTAPSPAAIATGSPPTRTVQVTAFVRGSIRDTVPSSRLTTQTAPSPTATALGALPTSIDVTTVPVARLEAGDRAGLLARDPDRTRAGRDRRRAGAEGDRAARAVRARSIRATALSAAEATHSAPYAGRQRARRIADVDALARRVRARIDLGHRARLAVGDPQRARAEGQPRRAPPTVIVDQPGRARGRSARPSRRARSATHTEPPPATTAPGSRPTGVLRGDRGRRSR